jgi:hypothetical protein
MECANTVCFWKSEILSAVDDELWGAPFANEARWIEPRNCKKSAKQWDEKRDGY